MRSCPRMPKGIGSVPLVLGICSPFGAQTLTLDTVATQNNEVVISQVSCATDVPLTEVDTEVRARVFVASLPEKELQYTWTATAGTIRANNSEATWSLKGVLSGRYQATVDIRRSGAKVADCSVSLLVVEPLRAGPQENPTRKTGRGFLEKGKKEITGYGLYSYFLLGSPPMDSNRARYLNAIRAYLNLISKISALEDYVSADKLNVMYLPVRSSVPLDTTAESLLENYDFARARVLLDMLPGAHNTGPYLLSGLKPLSSAEPLSSPYLFQDLSSVPTEPRDLMSAWILEFMNLAAQERFWQPKTAELLTLKVRTAISVLAVGLPEVQKQLTNWIKWAN